MVALPDSVHGAADIADGYATSSRSQRWTAQSQDRQAVKIKPGARSKWKTFARGTGCRCNYFGMTSAIPNVVAENAASQRLAELGLLIFVRRFELGS